MPYTNLAAGYVASYLLGGVSFTVPATWYFALSSTQPTQSPSNFWSFGEPTSQGGYARVAVANSTANFGPLSVPLADGYANQSLVNVSFPASTGAWSTGSTTLGWVGLFDSAGIGSGNLWMFASVPSPVAVTQTAQVIVFDAAQFVQTFPAAS